MASSSISYYFIRPISMSDLILFNKPYGIICQFSPHEKHGCLKDFINTPGFYPAGRLDTDSEGLLLLTNNGSLQARISNPKFKTEKTYWAQVEGTPDKEKLSVLSKSMDLGDFITLPAKIRVMEAQETEVLWPRNPPIRIRKTVTDFWLEIKIKEGKNRQVRRMTAKAGYPCLRLSRASIGSLNLFDINLLPGQWVQADSKLL